MIRIYCDRCQKDCGSVAYDIQVAHIHDPKPLYKFDKGDPQITCDKKSFRFVLCQNCYRNMGFPNYYKTVEEDNLTPLTFREKEEKYDRFQSSYERFPNGGK